MRRTTIYLVLMLLPWMIQAQRPSNQSPLTVKKIMQDPADWIGSLPDDIRWSDDGQWIYFKRNPENRARPDLFRVAREGGETVKISLEKEWSLPAAEGDFNRAHTLKVYARDNQMYLHHIDQGKIQKLVAGTGNIRNALFTHDEKGITFTMEGNLWKYDLEVRSGNAATKMRRDDRAG